MRSFDYIVVGSGSAGAVVAGRCTPDHAADRDLRDVPGQLDDRDRAAASDGVDDQVRLRLAHSPTAPARPRSSATTPGSTSRNRSASATRASAVGLPSTRSLAMPPSG